MAISILSKTGIEAGTTRFEFAGLSTDTKPTGDSVQNGSSFIEMDTGKLYFYDSDNSEWRVFNA